MQTKFAPTGNTSPKPDDSPVRGSSYVAIAYSRIRHMILSGELPLGSRVTVRPLVDQLELSPTPIRAALAALERQGLLESREHRGYFVPTLSKEDMLDIYEIRAETEGLASRRVATRGASEEFVAGLTDLVSRQRACVEAEDFEGYGDLDAEFHAAIWHASGSQRLAGILETLAGQVRMGNNISARAPGRAAASLEEHAEIIAAIQCGDAATAEALTRAHIGRAQAALIELLD